jgi:hypothetical protein
MRLTSWPVPRVRGSVKSDCNVPCSWDIAIVFPDVLRITSSLLACDCYFFVQIADFLVAQAIAADTLFGEHPSMGDLYH